MINRLTFANVIGILLENKKVLGGDVEVCGHLLRGVVLGGSRHDSRKPGAALGLALEDDLFAVGARER